jgi:hypothetical protein
VRRRTGRAQPSDQGRKPTPIRAARQVRAQPSRRSAARSKSTKRNRRRDAAHSKRGQSCGQTSPRAALEEVSRAERRAARQARAQPSRRSAARRKSTIQTVGATQPTRREGSRAARQVRTQPSRRSAARSKSTIRKRMGTQHDKYAIKNPSMPTSDERHPCRLTPNVVAGRQGCGRSALKADTHTKRAHTKRRTSKQNGVSALSLAAADHARANTTGN